MFDTSVINAGRLLETGINRTWLGYKIAHGLPRNNGNCSCRANICASNDSFARRKEG
jgi:hypothetical protein